MTTTSIFQFSVELLGVQGQQRVGDGSAVSTLETRIRIYANKHALIIIQHQGIINCLRPAAAHEAASMLVNQINTEWTALQTYLALREMIRSQPKSEREQYVRMQPIEAALQEVLRGE